MKFLSLILMFVWSGIVFSQTDKDCSKINIDDFKTFLGISYGGEELSIEKIIGIATGGEYAKDSSSFKYYFKNTKRVPVTVHVNSYNSNIETIFIEILGLEDSFDGDVKKAKEDFILTNCQYELFGKQPKEITQIFGQASIDNIKDSSVETDVRRLVYYNEAETVSVTFKFYPSQDNKLSSIEVNWYY